MVLASGMPSLAQNLILEAVFDEAPSKTYGADILYTFDFHAAFIWCRTYCAMSAFIVQSVCPSHLAR